jgi:hypothetical protein
MVILPYESVWGERAEAPGAGQAALRKTLIGGIPP